MNNTYLLLGPELGQKQDFVDEIKAKLPKDTEFYKFYPYEEDIESFLTALMNSSLFSSSRFIWLDFPFEYSSTSTNRQNFIKAPLSDFLLEYLNNPSNEVTLLLTTVETRINKVLMDLIPKNNQKIFYEMFENQKSGWIKTYFKKNSLSITNSAIEEILVLVENNTKDLKDICSQLVTYHLNCTEIKQIDDQDIEKYLIHTKVETGFSLFSYLALRNLNDSLQCLHNLYQTNSYQIPAVLASLNWCFRRLENIQENLILNKVSIASAFENANVFGSKASIYRYKDKTLYTEALKNFSLKELKEIIIKIAYYEVQLRQIPTDLHLIYLEKLIYGIVIKKDHID
ncbi:MAG: DNA polymerase III subunit delta [Sphaerochaetaceae bacterium]